MSVMKDEAIKQENGLIDLTPTKQGYAAMAALFGDNLVFLAAGSKKREDARALLGSVINIAGHLGNAMAQGDEEAKEAYEWLVAKFPQDRGGA
jgi:hypothetical protein